MAAACAAPSGCRHAARAPPAAADRPSAFFVEIGADERDAATVQPGVHFGSVEAARPNKRPAPWRRIERRSGLRTVDSFDDHRVVTHRAADETALAGKSRRRAFAHDPKV